MNSIKSNDEYVYQVLNNSDLTTEVPKAGEIFLGCVPLCFYGLSYLYWRCCEKGAWKEMKLNDRDGSALKNFMGSQGFDGKHLKHDHKGAEVAAALENFNGFKSALARQNSSFTDFLKSLRNVTPTTTTTHPLSTLFLGASCYFESKRPKAPQPPSSIRSMLYWLSGLTLTPQFYSLLDHFSTAVPPEFKVAISGSSKKDETLKPDDLAGHLVTSSLSSSWILETIQGPGDSNNPLLHEIYCSVDLSYHSSPSVLLSKLADYAYALQFQLHFLYQQCSNTYTHGCGWRHCRYGEGVNNGSKTPVLSHICNGYNCTEISKCKHDGTGGTNCNHNKSGASTCGQNPNVSPLQAFLTDKLKGFRRDPSDPYSHLASCSGSLCHVPMGFESHLRADDKYQGSHISLALGSFCGGFKTPLRQLSEKLGCLTKRTPRTLGDLFGFTWHLNGQLFKNAEIVNKLQESLNPNPNNVQEFIEKLKQSLTSPQSSPEDSGLVRSLQTMASIIPFLYQLFMADADDFLASRFYNLKGTKHNAVSPSYSGEHHDLYSLYNSNCTTPPNQSCGPYLYPLTHSDGATYAPRNASTYLSWVLYLSDDLQSWFQEMLDEFKNIDCKALGCKSSCSHASGTHGNPSCKCNSVVQCGGTLPLLYRHGFRYFNPAVLMGSNTKRDCKAFAEQLQSVITGNPLTNLLNTIDAFLYAIRWEFFSKLSGFWTIYVCIILYTFFFLLDTLRVRSHLHFPSSNSMAPISLLGTGKAPALRKLTKLTYFTP